MGNTNISGLARAEKNGHTYAISVGNKCSLRRPRTSGLIAGWGPAASDLTARYEDVRTRLDGLSIVPSFRVSVSVSRGAAITAIRDVPRVLSVRTEDLSAGLLHVGELPCSR